MMTLSKFEIFNFILSIKICSVPIIKESNRIVKEAESIKYGIDAWLDILLRIRN